MSKTADKLKCEYCKKPSQYRCCGFYCAKAQISTIAALEKDKKPNPINLPEQEEEYLIPLNKIVE